MKELISKETLYERFCQKNPQLVDLIPQIEMAVVAICECYAKGGRVFCCGNGGSSSDSAHIVGELLKGFLRQRPLSEEDKMDLSTYGETGVLMAEKLQGSLAAIDLTTQQAIMSAVANDTDPRLMYAQQLWGLGREGDVFSLIGPKRYDAPWKDMENQGWIAPADCVEVRVDLTESERLAYATAEPEDRYRFCASSETKTSVVREIVERHSEEQVLVIGSYIDQLDELGERLGAPVIKGETRNKERERLFDAFRSGELRTLVVSKVANFSIDLPEAGVAVQVSGSFGSRQEEAQRLGRVLRPKADGRTARFYAVVARDTLDQDYAAHRQRFLAEQGYAYRITDAADLLAGDES